MIRLPKNPIGRLMISSIKVDAPIFKRRVKEGATLPPPYTPDDIIYYDFSHFSGYGGIPGKYGNSIFTGHVDSGFDYCNFGETPPPCKAVLWDLDRLSKKDFITLNTNSNIYTYRVISNTLYDLKGRHWKNLFKTTQEEIITVFTCSGEFDIETHDYKSRLVIRARRINKNDE